MENDVAASDVFECVVMPHPRLVGLGTAHIVTYK